MDDNPRDRSLALALKEKQRALHPVEHHHRRRTAGVERGAIEPSILGSEIIITVSVVHHTDDIVLMSQQQRIDSLHPRGAIAAPLAGEVLKHQLARETLALIDSAVLAPRLQCRSVGLAVHRAYLKSHVGGSIQHQAVPHHLGGRARLQPAVEVVGHCLYLLTTDCRGHGDAANRLPACVEDVESHVNRHILLHIDRQVSTEQRHRVSAVRNVIAHYRLDEQHTHVVHLAAVVVEIVLHPALVAHIARPVHEVTAVGTYDVTLALVVVGVADIQLRAADGQRLVKLHIVPRRGTLGHRRLGNVCTRQRLADKHRHIIDLLANAEAHTRQLLAHIGRKHLTREPDSLQ